MTKEYWILRADFRHKGTSDDCLLAPVFVQESQVAHIPTLKHDSSILKLQIKPFFSISPKKWFSLVNMQRAGTCNSEKQLLQANPGGETHRLAQNTTAPQWTLMGRWLLGHKIEETVVSSCGHKPTNSKKLAPVHMQEFVFHVALIPNGRQHGEQRARGRATHYTNSCSSLATINARRQRCRDGQLCPSIHLWPLGSLWGS